MKRMVKMFRTVARIQFLGIILATICYDPNQSGCSAGVSTTVSYKDRTIGCLYSDVCPEDQVCFDDHAFGRCEQYDPKTETFTSDYIYELDRKTLQLLEKEWNRLNRQGFSWLHPYTQCILKVILNDRPRLVYDPEKCEQYLKPSSTFVSNLKQNGHISTGHNKFEEGNGSIKQQQLQQQKLLDQVSSSSVPKSDDDLFMNIEQTLSKYLVPTLQENYDGPTPSLSEAESGQFQKPETTIEKQQQQQHQNDLNKESLPLISLFPPPSPPKQPGSSSSSAKKSSSPKNFVSSQTQSRFSTDSDDDDVLKTSSIPKHIDIFQLFPELLNNVPVEKQNNYEDGNIKDQSWEVFDPEKNRDLIDYLQDTINNVNYNDDDATSGLGLSEYSGTKNSNNQEENPEYNSPTDEESNYLRKSLLKAIGVNDFPHEIQEEFNDPDKQQKLIESLFHDSIDDDNHYDDGVGKPQPGEDQQQSPLMSLFKIPEIRIIRDTEDTNQESDLPFDLTLIETSSQSSAPSSTETEDGHDDEDVVLVDFDDEMHNNDNGRFTYRNPTEDLDLDYGDLLLLNQIFDGKLIKDSLEEDDDATAAADDGGRLGDIMANLEKESDEDVSSTDNDDQNVDDRKEILIGDINYSNSYLLPNFYRNHRYDIKKPGPIFLEDYILENLSSKPDSDRSMINGGDVHGMSDNVLTKKDFSIRSQQPVAEGPVKLDSASKDQLIIRSATVGERTDLEAIDSTHAYVVIDQMLGEEDSESFLQTIEQLFNLPRGTFSNLRKEDYQITFKVNPNYQELNASQVASRIEDSAELIKVLTGYTVKETGIGDKTKLPVVSAKLLQQSNDIILRMTLLVCTIILSIISGAFVLYLFRRNVKFREKIKGFMKMSEDWIKFDYQDLCRQRFRNKTDANKSASDVDVEKKECKDRVGVKNVDNTQSGSNDNQGTSPPSRSSTSSYVEEPVSTNMDITTGHIILSYMEDHLKRKDRLDREWEALCTYEADPCSTNAASQKKNANKNRYPNVLPYDHSRVILNDGANSSNSDYINANTITDHDPRNPAYIATQGPLPNTKADFWQMIWEQGSVLIVMLTRLRENGLNMCDRYWPEEGSEVFGNFEIHLVSEHIWCDDYLVRSFYLKNLKTSETRTVTQFHYLSWPENGVPQSIKSLLDFRRKVNKSYKGRSCPIVVHCNDGVGRTGTYILIDMVLNRLAKGAKEIDLAASLEHIRDQRNGMVKTKQQFEFVLSAVADEVQAILKTLPN